MHASTETDASGRVERILLALVAIDCLAVVAIWKANLAGGAFPAGLFAYQLEGTVPIFHLTAEFLMAGVTVVGLLGLWRRRAWGPVVLLLGLGMFAYSAINALGWALHNDPSTAVPMFATLLLVALLVPTMVRRLAPQRGPR
jgi:hypothetical protein